MQATRREAQAGLDVFGLQVWQLVEDLLTRQARSKEVEHVGDTYAHATPQGRPPHCLGLTVTRSIRSMT